MERTEEHLEGLSPFSMGYTAEYADGCSIPSGGCKHCTLRLTVDSCPGRLHGCNRLWSWDLEVSEWSFALNKSKMLNHWLENLEMFILGFLKPSSMGNR